MSLTRRLQWLEEVFAAYCTATRPDEWILSSGRDAGLTDEETTEVWISVMKGRTPTVDSNLSLHGMICEVGEQKRIANTTDD